MTSKGYYVDKTQFTIKFPSIIEYFTKGNLIPTLLGLGMALFPIHNKSQPFLNYAFLPQIGFALIVVAVMLQYNKRGIPHLPLFDSKHIYIPLLLIIIGILARLLVYRTIQEIATLASFVVWFGVYLVGKEYKEKVWRILVPFVLVEIFSCIVYGFVYPGIKTGGIITTMTPTGGNYDIVIGYVVLIVAALISIYQHGIRSLILIALIGLYFTGSPEGVFVLVVLCGAFLVRRDIGRRLYLTMAVLALVVVLGAISGNTQKLYSYVGEKMTVLQDTATGTLTTDGMQVVQGDDYVKQDVDLNLSQLPTDAPMWQKGVTVFLTGRNIPIKRMFDNFSFLGHGYELTKFTSWTVHNVPLIILDQIGVLPFLAWCWVTIYCLIKSKFSYAWIAVIALGVFDHYVWDELAPYWWLLVGTGVSWFPIYRARVRASLV